MVQPWTVAFNPVQPYLSVVMTWVRLPGLPSYMYKCKILMEIVGTIRTVAKLDLNTDSRIREHFAGLVVYVDLDKPLVSQILINDILQKVEYEFFPTICFGYGRYGHLKKVCPTRIPKTSISEQ